MHYLSLNIPLIYSSMLAVEQWEGTHCRKVDIIGLEGKISGCVNTEG
jgi:hypothetical protein